MLIVGRVTTKVRVSHQENANQKRAHTHTHTHTMSPNFTLTRIAIIKKTYLLTHTYCYNKDVE